MAQWKKVIVSGSAAELSSLALDTALPVSSGGTGQVTLSSGQVLLGNGTSGISSVARGTPTGDGKIIPTGANSILGSLSFVAGGGLASGSSLNDISGLSSADSNFIVGSATGWVVESGATARTSLGLGTSDNVTFNNLNITNDVTASIVSASFLIGDGSQITGLPSAAINAYTNTGDNRIITSVDASSVQGEANLLFNGSHLGVTGSLGVSGNVTLGDAGVDTVTINAATINVPNIAAGTDNTVVVYNGSTLVTDEIDSRVWGTTLVDGSGASTRLAYWSDTNSLTSNAGLTFNGTDLTVGSSTFGTNVVIAGNLVVNGDTISQNVANVAVEDRFILLNSGSATGDGGIIVQTETAYSGSAFGWDDSATRWAVQNNTKLGAVATAMAPDAYVAMAVDVDGGLTDIAAHQKNGNIKIESGEIFIYA